MKCKKHFTDLSSTIGVCASCLRERLFVLIAAQVQSQSQAVEDRRKSDSSPNPPPLIFPRSVSPYISRRKSDTTTTTADAWNDTHRRQRFYSTPQVGPTGSLVISGPYCNKKKKNGRFSLFANLFRSKSEKLEESSETSGSFGQIPPNCTESFTTTTSSSSSWFSNMLPGRRKKHSRTFSVVEESTTIGSGPGHRRRVNRENPNRGMSPARYSDAEKEEDEHCPNGYSGYSSESSSQPWKQTPRQTPVWVAPGGKRGGGGSRNVSGMGFCLSPLVRASPSRQWNQKGGIPPEMVVSGDIRVVPVKPRLSTSATSFCKNRSRKLADFGRFHHNR